MAASSKQVWRMRGIMIWSAEWCRRKEKAAETRARTEARDNTSAEQHGTEQDREQAAPEQLDDDNGMLEADVDDHEENATASIRAYFVNATCDSA